MAESWRAEPTLVWTRFDDSNEWVVFHPASGHVHSLSAAAHGLWALAAASPRTTRELCTALAAELDRPVDAELEQATRETVAFMDRAGLLRPGPG
jgi:PqqD family protein of HPr-rel-A system